MRKLLRLFILMSAILVCIIPQKVYAISQSEAGALPIQQFSTNFGENVTDTQIDTWYHFRISERGKVRFNIAWDNICVDMSLCRQSDLAGKITGWHGSYLTNISRTEPFGLEAGDYYLHVYSFTEQTASYRINIEFSPNNAWEMENFNDTQPYPLTNDILYYGTLYKDSDVDLYEINMEKDGYFTFHFSPDKDDCDLQAINQGWVVEVINPLSEKHNSVQNEYIKTSYDSYKYPFKKGKYTIKVKESSSGMAGQVYNIKANIVYADNWENEDNNANEGDTRILPPNTVIYGNSTGGGWDLDFYKMVLDEDADVSLSFKRCSYTNPALINDGWDVRIYDSFNSDDSKLITSNVTKDSATLSASLKKGTYYVWVSASDWGYRSGRPEGVDYEIKYTSTPKVVEKAPGKAALKKITISKGKAKLSWKKVSDAKGYEIWRSTKKKKGYKKIATIKKTSYKDKKVKKKKTYYYKIRAYKVVNGKKLYGKYSSVKKIKL